MSRLVSFALFFTIMLTLVGAVHYYIWARLVRDLALPPAWHRALTTGIVVLFVLIPLSFFVRRTGAAWTVPIVWVASIWTGLLLLFLVVLGASDAGRGLVTLATRFGTAPPPDPERRVVLARLFGLLTLLVTGGLAAVAVRSGLAKVALREVSVRLRRLPRTLDGTTIVQLTDVHVGPTIGRAFIEEIVERTNAANPDVIAITGDLVDGSVEDLREHVAPLAKLKARYGVYFVTGNHEYYSGAGPWCAELTRLGIRVLRNERVSIGEGEHSFDLAGIDDAHAHQFGDGHGADLARAVAGRDPTRELVLLAHQPRAVFEAVQHGVGLQLSGHTHGGQIWPWSIFVRLQQPVVAGLARFSETQVYVSRGTGYWGPPMRLAAPAEITRVTLRTA
ncbi:MAG TPA: metallophosphoesterase [Polyangiaceae bacterium]|nr:metallophosphoesterase [Polyangiaceae bacterium]